MRTAAPSFWSCFVLRNYLIQTHIDRPLCEYWMKGLRESNSHSLHAKHHPFLCYWLGFGMHSHICNSISTDILQLIWMDFVVVQCFWFPSWLEPKLHLFLPHPIYASQKHCSPRTFSSTLLSLFETIFRFFCGLPWASSRLTQIKRTNQGKQLLPWRSTTQIIRF